MAIFFARMPDLALPINAAAGDSNVLDMKKVGYDAEALTFIMPAALDAVTLTLMVSVDGGVTYATHQLLKSDGTYTDLTLPAATKSFTLPLITLAGVTNLKIHSSGAVVAIRTIQVGKSWSE